MNVNITPELVEARLRSWDDAEWELNRANYFEYQACMGDEATRSFEEFCFNVAAQNLLFDQLTGER